MTGPNARKFLFETVFDAFEQFEEIVEEEEVEPPPPTFSEAELAAAREQAFAEGRAAGIAEVEAGIDRRIAELMEQMARQIEAFGATQSEALHTAEDRLLALATGIARKVVPSVAREHAQTAVEEMIRECLPQLREEPRIVVRVHETVLEALRERVDAIATKCGFGGDVILLAEEGLAETDCRVEWSDGGAERTMESIWAEIDRIVNAYLAAGAPSATQTDPPEPAPEAGEPDSDEENLNG